MSKNLRNSLCEGGTTEAIPKTTERLLRFIPARPHPDPLTPPNGKRGSERTESFTKHEPVFNSFSAILSPRSLSFVKTADPNPKLVALATLIASFSLLTFIKDATGPNISSSCAGIPGDTFDKTVGG